MTDLINRINRLCIYNHLVIDHKNKRIVFTCGIRLDKGHLFKDEYFNALGAIIQDSFCWFPILRELATSKGTVTELIKKRIPCYCDETTIH